MISALFVLGSAALISAQPTPAEPQPYYMQKASNAMVNYAVKYRKTDVPEAQASSVAVEVVNSILAPAQATDLVKSAASYYAANGPTVSGRQADALVSKASSYYDELATKPAYKSFAALVAEKTPLFDVSRAVTDAQKLANGAASKQPERINKAMAQANRAYASLKADTAGAAAVASGKSLAKQVAGDFKVDTQKVKSKFHEAKTSFVNALFQN